MPPVVDRSSWWERLLAKCRLFTLRAAREYAFKLGERTRDHTRRRDAEVAQAMAEQLVVNKSRQAIRALPPAKVAQLIAKAIRETPDDIQAKTTEEKPHGIH